MVRGGLAPQRGSLEVGLEGVPPELDGLRIAHLSDLHLGVAFARAPRGARRGRLGASSGSPTSSASPAISSRDARGCPSSSALLARARRAATSCSATTTSPTAATRSRSASTRRAIERLAGVVLLGDEAIDVELRGRRVQLVGVDPQTYAARTASPERLAETSRPAHPPLPLPGDRAPHPGCLPPRPRGAPARGPDRRAVPGRQAPASRTYARVTSRALYD